ncbi:histone-lysine N-methyltransferase [Abeliophyllum distichum]|uniref:Histone-lysine N-methyltransferase n=1 Tax=Abeliophyllum distichum TaxID=126358 RepID=A0ABD1VZX4_9LAMI
MKPLGVELLSDLENNSVKEINKTEGSEDVTLANNTVLEETKHVSRICTSVDGVDSTVGSKLSSPSQLPIMNGNIKQETSLRLKDKYCQRRVSAIRDFPPLCGRNFLGQLKKSNRGSLVGMMGWMGLKKLI